MSNAWVAADLPCPPANFFFFRSSYARLATENVRQIPWHFSHYPKTNKSSKNNSYLS